MSKNVLFFYSLNVIESVNKPLHSHEQMQFGISYISSLLLKHGYQTKLIVLSRTTGKNNETIIDDYLKRFNPGLICFTAISTEFQFTQEIAQYIRSHYPDIYLIVGGPHVSLNPDDDLLSDFDALCVGEGEYPVLELISQLEQDKIPGGVPNLWIKHNSKIEKNPTRPFLQDLNSLPFPDREMWKEWIEEKPGSRYSVLLGRGCPFQCTYCCNHAIKGLAAGPYVRFRSPDNILKEIKEVIKISPTVKDFYLEVETFGVNKKWALELCSKFEDFNSTLSKPLSFGVNLRITPSAANEDFFIACKKSNFKYINIGIESGSERVRREILKRNYSNENIIDAVALAKKSGLRVNLYNMIGLPNETLADFKETIKVNRACLPDSYFLYMFYPYPGTRLHSLCKEQNLLKGPLDTKRERRTPSLDLPGFSKRQIQKNYIWFEYHIYKGHRPTYKLLIKVFAAKLRTKSFLYFQLRKLPRLAFFKWLRKILAVISLSVQQLFH